MQTKEVKKTVLYIIVSLIAVFALLFILLGYVSSYIGYYGYNKHKYRRFSGTVEESQSRNVFVRNLHHNQLDSIIIDDVFIEKGYKWSSLFWDTKELLPVDTLYDNKPWLPYQLIVQFKDEQGNNRIAIPEYRTLLYDSQINDTLRLSVFIRDSINRLVGSDTLKIWQHSRDGNMRCVK